MAGPTPAEKEDPMIPSRHDFPDRLVQGLRSAARVAVITGAGISAESGIPTFRQAQTGLWERYRPEELATPEAFLRDPRLVWEWYRWRRELVSRAEPNDGHRALAALAERIGDFALITQNVDGLHQRAGCGDVIELHGNILRVKCFDGHHPAVSWPEDGPVPPRCSRCDSLLRPDVVWFGEALPAGALARAVSAARACEWFFSIGTSSVVYPAAGLLETAIAAGAKTVEINPNPTPHTENVTYRLRGPAGAILPRLMEAAWPSGALTSG